MRNLLFVFCIIFLVSCDNLSKYKEVDTSQAKETLVSDEKDELKNLLKLEGATGVKITEAQIVPDSLKREMANYIKELVSAASFHMTGGDYEDPEDVIKQAEKTAITMFTRTVKVLSYKDMGYNYFNHIIPVSDAITIRQKRIYELVDKYGPLI